jgi:hypothetical protein
MQEGRREQRPLIEIEDVREVAYEGGIVRLSRAALCVNCERITETWRHRCPCCGSPSLLSLARILDRTEASL